MSDYYTGEKARSYNTRWRTFTEKTIAATGEMIDVTRLRQVQEQLGRKPRVLDVACGTGVLLRHLIEVLPDVEAYGVDASARLSIIVRRSVQPWDAQEASVADGEGMSQWARRTCAPSRASGRHGAPELLSALSPAPP